MEVKVFRKLHLWNLYLRQTESMFTYFAKEMDMLVVMAFVVLTCAYFILDGSASIFDGVYKMVFEENTKCTENSTSVCGNHTLFQLFKTDRIVAQL